MTRILVVDDDRASCRMLEFHLRAQGHQAASVHDVDDALERLAADPFDLLILDIRMPGRSGLEGLPEFRARHPRIPVIMITAFHDMDSTIEAMQQGAADYIHKPIDLDELDAAIAKLAPDRPREQERLQATASGGRDLEMVGRSRAMKEVFKTIGLVARGPATVLITGESGTGKELVARAIHRAGEHPEGPFVAVNCAAVVETLLESDLFGHEKGAFSGAVGRQTGKFALARGGTIFLDEVGEMSPAMQAKLLRVLQYKEFTPLGAKEAETTDARIIAATNEDLAEAVAQGRFREDLYYRLQVVNIHLPPLRERREDLLDLVQALLGRINRELRRGVTHISRDVLEAFEAWDWPGNVRELENTLMKAAALSSGDTLTLDLLPGAMRRGLPQRPAEPPAGEGLTSLAEAEKAHVLRVLQAVDWHRGRACGILGVSRPRLRRMMREYGLEPPGQPVCQGGEAGE